MTNAEVQVYYVYQDKTGKTFMKIAKENTVELRTQAGGRVDISLTSLTRVWMRRPTENLGVVVRAHVRNGKSHQEIEVGKAGSLYVSYTKLPNDI